MCGEERCPPNLDSRVPICLNRARRTGGPTGAHVEPPGHADTTSPDPRDRDRLGRRRLGRARGPHVARGLLAVETRRRRRRRRTRPAAAAARCADPVRDDDGFRGGGDAHLRDEGRRDLRTGRLHAGPGGARVRCPAARPALPAADEPGWARRHAQQRRIVESRAADGHDVAALRRAGVRRSHERPLLLLQLRRQPVPPNRRRDDGTRHRVVPGDGSPPDVDGRRRHHVAPRNGVLSAPQ